MMLSVVMVVSNERARNIQGSDILSAGSYRYVRNGLLQCCATLYPFLVFLLAPYSSTDLAQN